MTDREFRRVMVIGALLLALLVTSFGLKSCDPNQSTYFINHSEIKDTTNEEYQAILKSEKAARVQKSHEDTTAFKAVQKDSAHLHR